MKEANEKIVDALPSTTEDFGQFMTSLNPGDDVMTEERQRKRAEMMDYLNTARARYCGETGRVPDESDELYFYFKNTPIYMNGLEPIGSESPLYIEEEWSGIWCVDPDDPDDPEGREKYLVATASCRSGRRESVCIHVEVGEDLGWLIRKYLPILKKTLEETEETKEAIQGDASRPGTGDWIDRLERELELESDDVARDLLDLDCVPNTRVHGELWDYLSIAKELYEGVEAPLEAWEPLYIGMQYEDPEREATPWTVTIFRAKAQYVLMATIDYVGCCRDSIEILIDWHDNLAYLIRTYASKLGDEVTQFAKERNAEPGAGEEKDTCAIGHFT